MLLSIFCFENIKFVQTTTSAKLVPNKEQRSVVARKCKNSQGVIFKMFLAITLQYCSCGF